MPGSNPLYYWDTCLFLAWIKDEERKTGEMAGVREIVARSKRRDVIIMTSAVTLTEVLTSRLPAGTANLFSGLLKRVRVCGVDLKIARMAHDLRDWYIQKPDKYDKKTLSVPDAMHLATAIMYRANEFHTFDNDNGNNSLGLLPLSGDVAGHQLIICKPMAKAPELDLRKPKNGS
jgi:predicted nucleic acid-binding protein